MKLIIRMLWQEKYSFVNLSLAFYNTVQFGTRNRYFQNRKWLMPEIHAVQRTHWRKLPYWVFIPVGLSCRAQSLILYHPDKIAIWKYGPLLLPIPLTTFLLHFLGPWQARLSKDPWEAQALIWKDPKNGTGSDSMKPFMDCLLLYMMIWTMREGGDSNPR